MAKAPQKTLASMVMLGINRIVVTDGRINAKVVFDMRAEDKAKRQYTASMLECPGISRGCAWWLRPDPQDYSYYYGPPRPAFHRNPGSA
jgi:hypothetical protein